MKGIDVLINSEELVIPANAEDTLKVIVYCFYISIKSRFSSISQCSNFVCNQIEFFASSSENMRLTWLQSLFTT